MAQEIRTRVAAAEEHARLDAEQVRYSKFTVASAHSSPHTNLTPCIWNEQRHSEERSALRAEKHAAVSVARQQVEAMKAGGAQQQRPAVVTSAADEGGVGAMVDAVVDDAAEPAAALVLLDDPAAPQLAAGEGKMTFSWLNFRLGAKR